MTMPNPSTGLISGSLKIGGGSIEFHRPSVIERTDQLNAAIDQVESAYAELRSCLEPVVMPSVPSPGPEVPARLASVDANEPSWISTYFDDVTSRVHQLAASVRAFTTRVDL